MQTISFSYGDHDPVEKFGKIVTIDECQYSNIYETSYRIHMDNEAVVNDAHYWDHDLIPKELMETEVGQLIWTK